MKLASFLSFSAWIALSVGAQAAGYALEQQNAAAIGSAYAGAQAKSGDVGNVYYNPAALAGIGRLQISANASAIIIDSSYSNAAGTLLGLAPTPGLGADSGALNDTVLPSLFVGVRVNDALALGFGLNAPFGLNSIYSTGSVARYHAIETDLKAISFNAAAALQLSPRLSVGGALRMQRLDFSVGNAIDAAGILTANAIGGFVPGTDDVLVALDAEDIAIGYQFGAISRPIERLRIGVNYTSKIEHEFSGDANFEIATSLAGQLLNGSFGLFQDTSFTSALSTPASVSVGGAYDISDTLTLKGSAVYTLWHSFEEIVATFDNPAQPAETLTQDWKDSWALSVGGDYAVSEHTTIRAGFMYDASPVSDTLASPRIPDADRYWINAGLSQIISDRMSLDLGAGYVFVDQRSILQSPALPENLFRGSLATSYDTNAFVLSLRLLYNRK